MRLATIAITALLCANALGASETTDPAVHPASGTATTVFRLAFTPRETPGHRGILDTSYRIDVAPPRGARAACVAGAPPVIDSGRAGQRRRVVLPPPRHGWCSGRYRVAVLLVQGPYCPPGHASPCPEFATRETPAGRTSFRVR